MMKLLFGACFNFFQLAAAMALYRKRNCFSEGIAMWKYECVTRQGFKI